MSDVENQEPSGLDVMMDHSDNEETNNNTEKDVEKSPETTEKVMDPEKVESEEEEDEPAGLDLGDVMNEEKPEKTENAPDCKWIKISNLMRPFTPQGLRKKITDLGGEIADPKTDFWLNSIKSMAFVKLANHDSVFEKVVGEMNGITWPDSSIKQLEVCVVDQVKKDQDVLIDQGGKVVDMPSRPVVVDHRANYAES